MRLCFCVKLIEFIKYFFNFHGSEYFTQIGIINEKILMMEYGNHCLFTGKIKNGSVLYIKMSKTFNVASNIKIDVNLFLGKI